MRKLTLCCLLLNIPFFNLAKSSTIYEAISVENLKSFSIEPRIEYHDFNSYADYMQWAYNGLYELAPNKKRKSVFNLFEDFEKNHPFSKSEVLDVTTWQDLNLLCGPRSDLAMYVANKIARPKCEFGRAALYRRIVNPTADINELLNLQAVVKELVENEELFKSLSLAYDDLAQAETLLLTFWDNDPFKSFAQRKEISFPRRPEIIDNLNKESLMCEWIERLTQVKNTAQLTCQAAAPLLLPTIAYYYYKQDKVLAKKYKKFAKEWLNISAESKPFSLVGLLSIGGLAMWIGGKAISKILPIGGEESRWEKVVGTLTPIFGSVTGLYYSWDTLKANKIGLEAIQAKLIAVAQYVCALKKFEDIFKNNEVLKEKLPALKNIEHVLHELPNSSPDFKKLVDNLTTATFQGKPSFFSYAGRILATYKLMNTQKDQLSEAFIALGEIDAYLAIATLYKEGQSEKNRWCFAEYISQASEPCLEIEEFWNPLLDPHTAVANSIAFNAQNNPRTLIVTGPNAGGKSTIVIKGIPLCLILAQSFGIAPAKRIRLTPFCKIITYLNITDDIAAGNSYFKAGVLRARHIINTVSDLEPGIFSFLSIDEAFNGTNHKIGQACACSLIEFLGNQPGILCATATHFSQMTRLEERTHGKLFKNYKVSVSYTDRGTIFYPFRIEPGISNQQVAFDILREEGFEDSFLKKAKNLLLELDSPQLN